MTMRCAELAYMARNLAGFTRERVARRRKEQTRNLDLAAWEFLDRIYRGDSDTF